MWVGAWVSRFRWKSCVRRTTRTSRVWHLVVSHCFKTGKEVFKEAFWYIFLFRGFNYHQLRIRAEPKQRDVETQRRPEEQNQTSRSWTNRIISRSEPDVRLVPVPERGLRSEAVWDAANSVSSGSLFGRLSLHAYILFFCLRTLVWFSIDRGLWNMWLLLMDDWWSYDTCLLSCLASGFPSVNKSDAPTESCFSWTSLITRHWILNPSSARRRNNITSKVSHRRDLTPMDQPSVRPRWCVLAGPSEWGTPLYQRSIRLFTLMAYCFILTGLCRHGKVVYFYHLPVAALNPILPVCRSICRPQTLFPQRQVKGSPD